MISVIVSIMFLVGCAHQELYYGHTGRITVNYNWLKSNVESEKTPDGIKEMTIYLFPENEDGLPLRYVLSGSEGGTIEAPLGHYKMIIYNSDTEVIVPTGGMTFETFGLRATNTNILSPLGFKSSDGLTPQDLSLGDDPVSWEVDPLWAGRVKELVITAGDNDIQLVVDMKRCDEVIDIKVNNVGNINNANAHSAAVDGMAYAYYPGRDALSEATTTIPFSIKVHPEDSSITGRFRTFGHCEYGHEHGHDIAMYFVLLDGNKEYYTYNITEQMHTFNAAVSGEVSLEFDDFSLPEILVGGDKPMADIEVSPWENENVPINI